MRISDWSSDVCSSDLYLFSDGDEDYLPDAALVADLYDNGSGMPNISNLTIDAFGFGVPGVDDFSADQLGKVETGSLGHGDEVTVISNTDDIAEVFSSTASTGEPMAAEALPLADLQIGRAHVGTPVTTAHLVCRLLIEKKQHT